MTRLFIYGTLSPGQPNHHVMEQIPGSWEEASLKGILRDEGWGSEMGCPGIVPSEDGPEVQGFLFSSEQLADHWQMLDEFEGEGYNRVTVQVKTTNGTLLQAQVYALNLSQTDQK